MTFRGQEVWPNHPLRLLFCLLFCLRCTSHISLIRLYINLLTPFSRLQVQERLNCPVAFLLKLQRKIDIKLAQRLAFSWEIVVINIGKNIGGGRTGRPQFECHGGGGGAIERTGLSLLGFVQNQPNRVVERIIVLNKRRVGGGVEARRRF